MVFINSRTGMMVKRAAIGSEGFVLNHYDRPALDRYLASVGDRLMTAFDKGDRGDRGDKGASPAPFAIFCDSLEVFDRTGPTIFSTRFSRSAATTFVLTCRRSPPTWDRRLPRQSGTIGA